MNERHSDSPGLPLRAMVMVLLFLGVVFLLVGFVFVVLLLLLLLLFEFLEFFLYELVIEFGIGIGGIEVKRALVAFERLFPGLGALGGVGIGFAEMKEGVAEIVVGLLLKFQIGRGEGICELFGGLVEFSAAICGIAGVVMEARVIGFFFEELLVFFEGLVVVAGVVLAKSGGRRSRSE